MLLDLCCQLLIWLMTVAQHDKCLDDLCAFRVGLSYHRNFGNQGCSMIALSTSAGPIRYPADVMMSSLRPMRYKLPSASCRIVSPVRIPVAAEGGCVGVPIACEEE